MLAILGRERGENLENILSRDQNNLEVWICSAKCHAQTDAVSVREFDVEQGDVDLSGKNQQPGVCGTSCRDHDIDIGNAVESGLEEVAIELVVFNYGNTNGGIVHTVIIAEVTSVFPLSCWAEHS